MQIILWFICACVCLIYGVPDISCVWSGLINRNIFAYVKKISYFYFLLSEQFFFYLIYFESTWTLFMLLFFSFPPNKVFASLTAVLIIFVGWAVHFRYAVWQKRCLPILGIPLLSERDFSNYSCIIALPTFPYASGVPVPEDVCGNTAFAEVCSPCARGCLHRDPAIRTDARISFVLLLCPCAVWVSFCPVPTHPPVHVHRPACFVLPLHEVCTFPIYL